MKKVIVIGAAVVDVILKAKALKVVKGHDVPGGVAICEVVGGKLEAEESLVTIGGGGANVAIALHRLGQAVKLISRVGSDDLAEVMIKQLTRENLDISMMQTGAGQTGVSVVLVSSVGSRSIVTHRGESGLIDRQLINWEEIKKADWIQVSSVGGEMEFLEDLVAFAVENGIRIGVNPGKKELEKKDKLIKLLPKIDMFNINRMEASQLLGVNYDNEDEMMKRMAEMRGRLVVITDGKKGGSVLEKRRWIKVSAFPVASIDDTGAGDAFVGGLVAGILQDRKVEESLKMGLANGASQVTMLGASNGLLYKNELEKWMKKKLKMVETWV